MSHSYVGLEEFKRYGSANLTSQRGDESILFDLEAASRQLERLLGGRRFYPITRTVSFSGNGRVNLPLPIRGVPEFDLISISSLAEDGNRDGVYETTWAATDYLLGPDGNDPGDLVDPRPYGMLSVDLRSSGSQDIWMRGQLMYQMVAKFGYCEMLVSPGLTINEGAEWSATDTTLIVTPQTGLIDVGETLVIESEQVYVTARAGNDYTVQRGSHGTTAAAHADSTAISKLTYPETVIAAVMHQARRLQIRNIAGYADQVGFDQTGAFTPQVGADSDFWQRVGKYALEGIY
jgi:hypothetical protein